MIFIIGIIKGDSRFTYLSDMLKDSILSYRLEDFYNIDILVLPMKGIDNYDIIYGTTININDIFQNNRIKAIVVGYANNRLKAICGEKNIKLYELMKNDSFVKANAFLTAKGVIPYLQNDISDISDYKILLVGYGNISYYLYKLLIAYNVDVTVYPMNDFERKILSLSEIKYCDEINGEYDFIINTVPKNINVEYSELNKSKILDIASYPYGFDPIKIDEFKVNYRIISQIPALFAPKSAAALIKKCINEINSIV